MSDRNIRNIKGSDYISGEHEKYCSCVLKVASQQDPNCILNKEYGKGKCYNPYAVCAKSTGDFTHSCSEYIDYNKMPTKVLRIQLELYGLPSYGTREELIDRMYQYKYHKYN